MKSKTIHGFVILLSLLTIKCYADSADLENLNNFKGGPINPGNVNQLQVDWEYLTAPDSGTPSIPIASVNTPAIQGKYIYFNDRSGNITKLDRLTGKLIWKKNYMQDLSSPGFGILESRAIPYLTGNLVIVGNYYDGQSPPCRYLPRIGDSVCHPADGAIVIALDQADGHVVWRQKIDDHPFAKASTSIAGFKNMLIATTSSWEEEASAQFPNIYENPINPESRYPCCSMRPSVVALDKNTGAILWKTPIVPGKDEEHNLPPQLHNMLSAVGFHGASIYGTLPATIDVKRSLVYVTSAENTTAPKEAQDCAKAMRTTGNPNANIPGLPNGVTCKNLNDKLHNYAHAIIALDLNSGKVKWAFRDRLFDVWNAVCSTPTSGVGGVVPVEFPLIQANIQNCAYDPIGPDMGFGQNPMLLNNVKMPSGKKQDILVAANKSGQVFAIDPDSGSLIYRKTIDPGGILGGSQFARATDGKTIFFGTSNSRNLWREKNAPFVSAQQFLDANGFGTPGLGIKHNFFTVTDTDTPVPYAAPNTLFTLPFPGPNIVYGPDTGLSFYPDFYPNPDNIPVPPVFITGPGSGPDPAAFWTLQNPPSDVVVDNNAVFYDAGVLKTISGTVTAMDLATGNILWQRPANDSSTIGGSVYGALTVGNGIVFAGYVDRKGTLVALDAKTGKKLFQFNSKIPITDTNSQLEEGCIEAIPLVVGERVYIGTGSILGATLVDSSFNRICSGNRLITLTLPKSKK